MTSPLDEKAEITVGMRVEKFTGEARWFGVVVSEYLTIKGRSRRFVVEVEPQGFQMIAVPSQLRPALAVSQPIGDGMEVVAWRHKMRQVEPGAWDDIWSYTDEKVHYWDVRAQEPLVRLSGAQALIAAKDARIEELTRERDDATEAFKHLIVAMAQERLGVGDKEGGGLFIRNTRAEAAEAQVKRLTEDNEALRRKLDMHEAALSFVHRWAVQKEGNGTSAEDRLSAIAHHPGIATLNSREKAE